MKKLLLLSVFLLSFVFIQAQVKHFRSTEICVQTDGVWSKWQKSNVDIAWSVDDNIVIILVENEQAYKLGKMTRDKTVSFDIIAYEAVDQDNVNLVVMFSKDFNGQHYITIGYSSYMVAYKVNFIQNL